MKMFNTSTGGANSRVKLFVFVMICAVSAMAWTFVKVGKQASTHQSRMTEVSEQLVLSQRIAKYALAAATGDTNAFENMGKSKSAFGGILERQMRDFGDVSGQGGAVESVSLTNLEITHLPFKYAAKRAL